MSDDSEGFPSDSYDSDASALDVDEDYDFEVPVAKNKGKGRTLGIVYESLSPTRLQSLVGEDISNIASVLGLESPIASILLQHFRWNRDKLIEKYMDSSACVLRDAGEPQSVIAVPDSPTYRPNKRARINSPSDSSFIYATSKVKEEGMCAFNCMQDGCATVVDESSIQKLVDKPTFDRRNWDVHGYNNDVCNTWKEPEPDAANTEAKQNLEKWLFYFDRFNNHELSVRLDEELVEQTEEKMLEVQESSELSWIEARFMNDAVEELTRCRVTLKWTYAMAYFLAPGNQKQIFEDIQADLEKAVENLSQLLEEPIEKDTVKSLRQRMVDKTVYVRGRHEIVSRDTAEGLAEGRWEWNLPLE
ncbi:uncharacterized protein FIBRA_08002 [Fibroporia radiculosa]|uniref:Uncharacterized protein n=1 Tax=Fibroporia radiculosa TaxID=599839 RepID=J4H4X9_9APHY|nr:uncharacterized protein FIBRA_08002 [Fibroporia radiculosa]CCM05769.1 predicted protein [Fibroporia radiculosa]